MSVEEEEWMQCWKFNWKYSNIQKFENISDNGSQRVQGFKEPHKKPSCGVGSLLNKSADSIKYQVNQENCSFSAMKSVCDGWQVH